MRDRQPTQVLSNGAIRYGVYNANGSLSRYEYLRREDEPSAEGTPLNKANLLSDATAKKIWPNADARPADPTVSEALAELKKGATKIGDILMTARAKPSDAWLLCNGQSITKSSYPQLFELLRSAASPAAWAEKAVTGIDRDTTAVCYANSKWFAFAGDGNTLHMYVSENTETWTHYSYSDITSASPNFVDMVYSAANDVYHIVCWNINSGTVALTLSSDFQTLSRNGTVVYTDSLRADAGLRLYEAANGTLFCVVYNNRSSPYTTAYYSTNGGDSWTFYRYLDAADYDKDLGLLYYVSGRDVYSCVSLTSDSAATLVGTIPETVIPSSVTKLYPFICLSVNTIIVAYDNGTNLRYAYSTDRGQTWSAGASPIATSPTSSSSDISIAISINKAFQYVAGLLIFPISVSSALKFCVISDPADQVYTTDVPDAMTNKTRFALSPDGLAIMLPTTTGVLFCNYADTARPVPTIIPDTRSKAYIKALEE